MPLPHLRSSLLFAALLGCGILSGCKTDEPTPDDTDDTQTPSDTIAVHGVVRRAPIGGGQPSVQANVAVRATIDRDGDGVIGPSEMVLATTDAEGAYDLTIGVSERETVVVGFTDPGAGALFRTLRAAPGADVIVDATLMELAELNCEAERCDLADGSLAIKRLPAGTGGLARVFNPVTEPDAFPGDFADDDGNLLISGVFANFDLKDDAGAALTDLDDPATIELRMPRDTWTTIVDVDDGNDRVDVPLYAFDEVAGTWTRDGIGHLVDGDGVVIAPGVLPSILDGTFVGEVIAVGDVTHFSSWNVDWPVASHGCVSGRIVDVDGDVLVGATAVVRGATYTGTSTPQTVGADGTFCVDVMRSEGPAEDVDGDGVPGEEHRVLVRVTWGGHIYDLGEVALPTASATCEAGGCLDLGDLVVSDDKLLVASLCTAAGVVIDVTGTPVRDASVYGWDESIADAEMEALCFTGTEFLCTFFATTDETGAFAFTTPVVDALTLWTFVERTLEPGVEDLLFGQRTVRGCPSDPVPLRLDQGMRWVTADLTASGGQIRWLPDPYDALFLVVSDAGGGLKWGLSSEVGIGSPVTYGAVPAGADQWFPSDAASPAALASGDEITVTLSGTTPEGIPYTGSASYTVP